MCICIYILKDLVHMTQPQPLASVMAKEMRGETISVPDAGKGFFW